MAAISINKEQFRQIISGEKPALVDFWAPWCGYCRRIAPAYDRIADEYSDTISVVKVNVDDEPQLAELEGIKILPTLMLYKNGKAVDAVVAPGSKAVIDSFVQEALSK